ncbi:MAG: HAMP domain-containing protein, partial [Chloroflexi bacterium]|nr:HAMP domain-containing protein [Chloroflexota bacterium]
MSLLKKTLLVIASVVVVSTAITYGASQFTLLRGYEDIERDDTQAHVRRTLKAFQDQVQAINLRVRAYAYWDDMYNYVAAPDPAFVDYLTLNAATYATHQIHLMAILDTEDQITFLKMFDLATGEEIAPPDALLNYLKPDSPLLGFSSDDTENAAVLLLDGQPMIVAAVAALHTDFTGEPRGAVLMGRYVDAALVSELGEITQLKVSAYTLAGTHTPSDVPVPADVRRASSILLADQVLQPIYIHTLNGDTIAGYTLIRALGGNPAFVYKIELPRDIYAHGQRSFRYFVLLAALSGGVLTVVTLLLLRHFVLSPLTRLSQQIGTIRASGDNSQRVSAQGQDELAQLGSTINSMLAALEARSNDLRLAKQEAYSARDKALEADKVKSQFLATVSHELRTPLNAIINFAQFVSSGLYGTINAKQVDALNKVTQSARHLLAVINDILDMSKIEAGQVILFVETEVDLRPELDAVVAETRALLNDKPVQVITDIADDLPLVLGDRRRIRQILLN